MHGGLLILDLLVAVAVAVVALRWAVLLGAAVARGRHNHGEAPAELTVVIPAFNEEAVLRRTLQAALACEGVARVLVVDDGSSDGTAAVVQRVDDPRLELLRHPVNRGKAEALNTGLRQATTPLVATLDADTLPERLTLRRLAAALSDPAVAGAACNLRVAGRDTWLQRCQALEYITAIHLGRRAQAFFGGMTTVPGALAIWRREVVLGAGGFSSDTLAEDTDLTLTLQRQGHRVRFVDDALAHTEAPATLRALLRQRRRWLHGNLQCALKHLGAFRDGPAALRAVALPDLWFTHLLVYALLPLTLLWLPQATARFSPGQLLALGGALLALDLLGAVVACRLDRARAATLWSFPLQRLVFPFLLWAVFAWVVLGWAAGASVGWGTVRAAPTKA